MDDTDDCDGQGKKHGLDLFGLFLVIDIDA